MPWADWVHVACDLGKGKYPIKMEHVEAMAQSLSQPPGNTHAMKQIEEAVKVAYAHYPNDLQRPALEFVRKEIGAKS